MDEAKLLARQFNLVRAAEQILTMGPKIVIVKKGESGALMCMKDGSKFVLPAYPATEVRDPTGAGDSFAGGLMGYRPRQTGRISTRSRRPWPTARSWPRLPSRISPSAA